MANSAFNHEPSFTIPGSTTDNAVIRWDGTSGGGQLNSGIIIDDSNVITGITSLQVDNLNLNGNTLSSTAGTDLFITPLGGQQLILDGTIVIDAGVVTNATSISSTEFVGGGVGLTALNADNIGSGTVPVARLGDGNESNSTFLRGDNTWQAVSGTTLNGNTDHYIMTGTGTANTLQGEQYLRWNGSLLDMQQSLDGDLQISVYNTRNVDNNDKAILNLRTGGANAGDPYIYFANAVTEWSAGLDNSDGDKWKLSRSGDLNVNPAIVVDTDNIITTPKQPCFGRRLASTVSNITGNGNGYVVVWEAISSFGYDYGGNCESNNTTFTAPVDGIYWFEAALTLQGIASNHTEGYIRIKTTSSPWLELINYFQPYANETSINSFTPVNITGTMELNANQGVVVDIKVYGGSQVVDVNGSTNIHSRWSGMLVA